MKRLFLTVLALVISVSVVSAQDAPPDRPVFYQFTGMVNSVSTTAPQFFVVNKGNQMLFTLAADAEGNSWLQLPAVGDEVTVRYQIWNPGATKWAVSIEAVAQVEVTLTKDLIQNPACNGFPSFTVKIDVPEAYRQDVLIPSAGGEAKFDFALTLYRNYEALNESDPTTGEVSLVDDYISTEEGLTYFCTALAPTTALLQFLNANGELIADAREIVVEVIR